MIIRPKRDGTIEQYRQGDLFLIQSVKPCDAVLQPLQNIIVLEYGEVTGHAHVIERTEFVSLFFKGKQRFLEVHKPTLLKHEEHASINLPAKTFEVRRQRTWSVLNAMSQRVTD